VKEKKGGMYLIVDLLWTCNGLSFLNLIINPMEIVQDATLTLCSLITGKSNKDIPYKFIRLLSHASYFIGLGPYKNALGNSEKSQKLQITELLKVWLLIYWPDKTKKVDHL
jgi:hypothetical protein